MALRRLSPKSTFQSLSPLPDGRHGWRAEDSPIAKLLTVLQALLNGSAVDMAAVKWLWVRIATGDFVMGAFPTHSHFRVPVRGMDKDVSASLALLLGPASLRRGSRCSDIDAGPAALSIKCGSPPPGARRCNPGPFPASIPPPGGAGPARSPAAAAST